MTKLIKEGFQKAVSFATKFTPLRPTLPVLNNIYLKAEKGVLVLRATNLETTIEIKVPAKVEKGLEITVPAKLLAELVSSVSEPEVALDLEKEGLSVSTADTQATLATISAAEFPQTPFLEKPKEAEALPTNQVYQAATKVVFAASTDEGKPILNSIYLENEGKHTVLVATDGYRLAKQQLEVKLEDQNLLVPARTFVETLKIATELGEETVEISDDQNANQLLVVGENFQLATRLISGAYPNYKQIIPESYGTQLKIKKEDLVSAIKTAAVFAKDLGSVITFEIGKDKLTVSANTVQIGESSTKVDASVEGEKLKVSFNSRYLTEGLTVLNSEEVKIEFSGALSPAFVTAPDDTGFSYLLMPVKAQRQ